MRLEQEGMDEDIFGWDGKRDVEEMKWCRGIPTSRKRRGRRTFFFVGEFGVKGG